MDRTADIARPMVGGAVGRATRRLVLRLRASLAAGWRSDDPVVAGLIAVAVLSAGFLAFPGIDMQVSAAFYRVDTAFWLSADPALKALRKSSSIVLALIALGLVVTLVVRGLRRSDPNGDARRAGVLLAGLALGPGLVVNAVLKEHWGRPRPVHLEAFGGEASFTPVWTVSDQCLSNCSFVSGEAASAAWMTAVAVILTPAPFRGWAIGAAGFYGVMLSLNRLAFGGHFLSDILLSWAIVGLVLAVLHRLTLTCPRELRRRRRARGEAAPAGLTRAG